MYPIPSPPIRGKLLQKLPEIDTLIAKAPQFQESFLALPSRPGDKLGG